MIPEVHALDSRHHVIRIPNQIDVPVTGRILQLIDTTAMRRLSRIGQLGLVSDVYPGGKHSRFEHSLGVYRNCLLFLKRLMQFDFDRRYQPKQIEALVIAALLHDIGHWPYCHVIEDMKLDHVPAHEDIAKSQIQDSDIVKLVEAEWSCDPNMVERLICNEPTDKAEKLLCSILSGPIDIDKMDYLYRDSLHCGVPYGMNFDSSRLINSICPNQSDSGIAINAKGKTAAEMMVFARYVMFSEVYWHHTVRSATTMLQRLCYEVYQNNPEQFFEDYCEQKTDSEFIEGISGALTIRTEHLFDCLFGRARKLFKRVAEYTHSQNPGIFERVAHRPYQQLVELNEKLTKELEKECETQLGPNEIIIDAPPAGLEVQFEVAVVDGITQCRLEELSPIVKALATKQFDAFVKKVRIYVHPNLVNKISPGRVEAALQRC